MNRLPKTVSHVAVSMHRIYSELRLNTNCLLQGSGSEGRPDSPSDSLDGTKKGERKKEFVCQVCPLSFSILLHFVWKYQLTGWKLFVSFPLLFILCERCRKYASVCHTSIFPLNLWNINTSSAFKMCHFFYTSQLMTDLIPVLSTSF